MEHGETDTEGSAPSERLIDRSRSLDGSLQIQMAELPLEDKEEGLRTALLVVKFESKAILKRQMGVTDDGPKDYAPSETMRQNVEWAWNLAGGDPQKASFFLKAISMDTLIDEASDLLAAVPDDIYPTSYRTLEELLEKLNQ